MVNKALRILESVKINAGIEIYENIIKAAGVIEDNANPNKQSKYVNDVVDELENTYGAEMVSKIMKPCGYQCISDRTIAKAKAAYKKAEKLDDFLRLLNEQHIGGGKLHICEDKIICIYEKCYCGLPKNVKGLSPEYCNCSAGWFERLFSSVLERDVEVRKLHTILDGSEQCMFEINI